MKYYRYEQRSIAEIGIRLELLEYEEVEKTPKGKWIVRTWVLTGCDGKKSDEFLINKYGKWIKDGSKWASETKEKALDNYVTRTKNRLKILESQAKDCLSGISQADYERRKLKETDK